MTPSKVYWDTTCFISYLSSTHPEEILRADICIDLLNHARNDGIEIWTSVWTIAETIRPKAIYEPSPLPEWASLLKNTDSKGDLLYPKAHGQFEDIWKYYKKNTLATRMLSDEHATTIKQMFEWPWIKTIQVIPAIAQKATEISRKYNMKPADAVHVASALFMECEIIHRWDRDYSKTDGLIKSAEPQKMSPKHPPGLFLEY